MDTRLKEAIDFSNYQSTINLQKKILKEKLKANLTFGYSSGIFYIDRSLITFVQLLITQERTQGVILLDMNENPILIDDLEKFQSEILDRYFSSTTECYNEYEKIKKNRTIEKLVEL